jgi:hypothetical protein
VDCGYFGQVSVPTTGTMLTQCLCSRLVLVNEGEFWLDILAESSASSPANRFRSSGQRSVAVEPGGSASFVYIVLRDGIGRWQLTGRG